MITFSAKDELRWLRDNLGDRAPFAGLTGQDSRALILAGAAIELYSSCDQEVEIYALRAFHGAVLSMQTTMQQFAYHLIAKHLNWEDRARLWAEVRLPACELVWICKYSPEGYDIRIREDES